MRQLFSTLFKKKKTALKNGRWKEFNRHGILIAVGNFHNDQKHGQWLEYYDTGELILEENYVYGISHGRYATYHPNGKLQSEGTYVNGKREGYFTGYDEDGVQIKSLLFSDDKLVEETEFRIAV
jgi:antitoxin component YwqK of YwqJK toxin-antitoxin module